MATTDSNGLVLLEGADPVAPLHTAINTVTASVSNYLSSRSTIHRVANTTARNALVASVGLPNITSAKPLLVWRADAPANRQLEFTTDGSNWTYYRSGADTDDIPWTTVPVLSGFTATSPVQVQRKSGMICWTGRVSRNAGAFPIGNNIVATATPSWANVASFIRSSGVVTNGATPAYITCDSAGALMINPYATGGNNYMVNYSYPAL